MHVVGLALRCNRANGGVFRWSSGRELAGGVTVRPQHRCCRSVFFASCAAGGNRAWFRCGVWDAMDKTCDGERNNRLSRPELPPAASDKQSINPRDGRYGGGSRQAPCPQSRSTSRALPRLPNEQLQRSGCLGPSPAPGQDRVDRFGRARRLLPATVGSGGGGQHVTGRVVPGAVASSMRLQWLARATATATLAAPAVRYRSLRFAATHARSDAFASQWNTRRCTMVGPGAAAAHGIDGGSMA
jgi:hypothetical protein